MARKSKTTPPASAPLVLPAELTIYTVGELQPQWLSWLGAMPVGGIAQAPVQAAAVDQIDAAGLQLLLSLGHALEALGVRLQLAAASPVLREGCAALGLTDWLLQHSAAAAAPQGAGT